MRITYDSKYDILYLALIPEPGEVETAHATDDIALDFDAQGRLAGIEVLSASKHLDLAALLPVAVEQR